ncbi:MAG: SH3 domain-containing protein [Peptococcaceae bacterium]
MQKRISFPIVSIFLMAIFIGTIFPGYLFAQDKYGMISGSIVNVRSGPGTEYTRIAQVNEGQFVSILSEENNWYQVKLADGKVGWLANWLISEQSSEIERAVVTGSIVNIREGPGTGYAKIGETKSGDKLDVLKSEGKWFLVNLPEGGQGWIANWLVQINKVAGAQVGYINGSSVNIRQGTSTTYPLLFQLDKGKQVTIKEENNGWYLIETAQGSGWVASWLVTLPGADNTARNAIVTGSKVNIRQKPTTDSPRVTQVLAGDLIEIIGEQQDWYQVKTAKGQEGWIAGWLVSLESSPEKGTDSAPPSAPPSAPVQTASPPENVVLKNVIVTGNIVNVRQGPSLDYATIGKVTAETELGVIGTDGEWLKVRLADGTAGWIAGWLTVDKNSQPLPTEYLNELKLTLDNERVLNFSNLGDKLSITLSGIKANQYSIKPTEGKLMIELESLNLRKMVQPLDNWGVKEIGIQEHGVTITFNKDFQHIYKYNNSKGSLEIEITYPAEQLIPVKQIKLNPQESQSVVQIAADNKIDFTTQELEPNRLVIDLPQSSLQLASKAEAEQNVAFGPIRKVTSRQLSPDLVRIEAEFVDGTQYQITQQDDYIVVGAKIAQQGGLAGKTIVIDPGHGSVQPGGWTDPGATGKILRVVERDVNLDVALKLQQILSQQGAKVVMTHNTGRTFLSLAGRADVANSINADIFVSIHANANNNIAIAGTSVYYYAPTWHGELASQRWLRQRLALNIQQELVKSGGRLNLGIKEENFAVLRETRVPSVLVEMAFLTNPEEERLLSTNQFRSQMAAGIFKGIEKYFNGL